MLGPLVVTVLAATIEGEEVETVVVEGDGESGGISPAPEVAVEVAKMGLFGPVHGDGISFQGCGKARDIAVAISRSEEWKYTCVEERWR